MAELVRPEESCGVVYYLLFIYLFIYFALLCAFLVVESFLTSVFLFVRFDNRKQSLYELIFTYTFIFIKKIIFQSLTNH